MVQDLGKMYENNAAHEKSDLNTVWESMYSKGLHRKVSSQCYYTPQEIEEARKKDAEEKRLKEEEQEKAKQELESQESSKEEKEETEAQTSPRDEIEASPFEAPRNFASVHFNRALNSGRAHMHDEGRRYRKRTFSGSLPGDGQEH
jgi:nitric oxide reductase activation protein